jgi:hypothetical protein
MASSPSPGWVAHAARPTVCACTRTLVEPGGSLRAGLGAIAWRRCPPPGVVPAAGGGAGLDWLPAEGTSLRLDLVPWWVRAWYQLPFIDRYAHTWMWRHGAWEVRLPEMELGHSGGTD